MSLKQELETWSAALDAYDAQEFDSCLNLFDNIGDSSKILFNIGLVQATIGSHDLAVRNFEAAVQLDEFLAVAYFQAGVSYFLLGRYELAKREFDNAYLYLRANLTIDYEQLGLKFKLYSCEVLFNRGLSSIYLGNTVEGMDDITLAMKEKQTDDHSVINEAYGDRGNGYTVFSIPVGVLYRPSEGKLKNIKTKDYLGTAKLIAATDQRDAFTGFTGSEKTSSPAAGPIAALARSGLSRSNTSGARLQSDSSSTATLKPRPSEATLSSPSSRLAGPPVPTKIEMQRSQTTIGRTLPAGPRKSFPTPPSSGEMDRHPDRRIQRNAQLDDADVLDYYAQPPTPSGQPPERVATWARETGRDPPQLSLSLSTTSASARSFVRPPLLGFTPVVGGISRAGGGSMRKDVYQTEDGSYVTGSYSGTIDGEKEMTKIRVKLRYLEDVRGMSISPDTRHEDFAERVRIKFSRDYDLTMKYKDADSVFISIVDDDDWESAIDEAREAARGRAEGKLEIYLSTSR